MLQAAPQNERPTYLLLPNRQKFGSQLAGALVALRAERVPAAPPLPTTSGLDLQGAAEVFVAESRLMVVGKALPLLQVVRMGASVFILGSLPL